jgi:hypothetical protein
VLQGLRRQAAEAEAAAHYDTAIARLLSLSLACQMMPDTPLPDVLDVWRASVYHPPAAHVCPLALSFLPACAFPCPFLPTCLGLGLIYLVIIEWSRYTPSLRIGNV